MDNITFCISAGQLKTKKENNKINRKNKYLNYGLLALASQLKEQGANPLQIHGHFDPPSMILKKCIHLGFNVSKMPLLISIPSYYAVSWTNEFITLAKNENPDKKIIIGGRWVIGDRPDLMKKLVPGADLIIPGTADSIIGDIVKSLSPPGIQTAEPVFRAGTDYPCLDYSLLHERHLYQPSVEISRGCGMGCSFCLEKNEKRGPLKDPLALSKEIESILLRDKLNTMTPYFEASHFVPNKKWISGLLSGLEKCSLRFNWRTEARMDTFNPDYLEPLARSGLKILDLGLESASHTQLVKMNKSKNPAAYLSKASHLIKLAHKHKIKVKINILLSLGENETTLAATDAWLEQHQQYITGISAGPQILFGWCETHDSFMDILKANKGSISHMPCEGITHLNLSAEMDYEKSILRSKEISRKYMTAQNYFYLKSFSYFPRDYSYNDFLMDLSEPASEYGFSMPQTQKICVPAA